jgi:replication initiator protein RepSA
MPEHTTRAEWMARPHIRDVARAVAEEHGACMRPVQLRKTNLDTGQVEQVLIPCGATLASLCLPCAERNKVLRAAQCREGWHLENEPIPQPVPPDDYQRWLTEQRADLQASRDQARACDADTAELDDLIGELDHELRRTGIRGSLSTGTSGTPKARRRRSTRRRQDAPDLPRRKIAHRTIGRTFTAPDGRTYRPSMFLTLTCDSYGPVRGDGTPADPGSYDYQRAARDAIHFPALFDRLIQNLRRFLGCDLQYFATIEPQQRLAPHAHIATRGTISRSDLRRVLAATYHQVWWPSTDTVRFEGEHLPVWHEKSGCYLDPATGELLPTWDEALDAIGPADPPLHVARFGAKFDAQGVLAGSKDSSRCIGYLTKYLVKDVGTCHIPETDAQREHVERLVDALQYEPCSPTCANWLRYGITPKHPRKGLMPGACKGKAHRPDHLGYAGRRVLVSRKWSGKTLADHRGDRKQWLMETLGLSATDDAGRYRWEQVTPNDTDYLPPPKRLVQVVAERMRWKDALDEARRRAQEAATDPPATGRAA